MVASDGPEDDGGEQDPAPGQGDAREVELASRGEWLAFLSDEIATRDRRTYWMAGLLALLASGCYYLGSRLSGAWLDVLDPRVSAPLALGLLLGLWASSRPFARLREALRPSKIYAPLLDAKAVPFVRLLSRGRLPFAVAVRQFLYAAGFGAVAWILWLLRGPGWALETLVLTTWAVLFGLGAFVFLLVTLLALLDATGLANWPSQALAWVLVFILDTRLQDGALTTEAEASLQEAVDEIDAPDGLKLFMVLLDQTGTGPLLGLPPREGSRSWKLRLGGFLVFAVRWTLLLALFWVLGRQLLPTGFPGTSYQMLGLSFLLPITARLALELVQNPARKLLEQLRLAVLHRRLTEEETVFAYMAVLSSEELGWWSPPQLMGLLVQADVVSRQRYLEALTYPRVPRMPAADLGEQSDDDTDETEA